MKKFFLIGSVLILTTAIFYSCTKNTKEAITEEQAVSTLAASESFIDFTKHFIPDFAGLMQYHRSPGVLANKKGFLEQVQIASNDFNKTAAAYRTFGLDYEKAFVLKNKLDNDILSLLNQNKFLLQFNEQQIERIILKGIDEGLHSSDPRWLEAKNNINIDLKNDVQLLTVKADGVSVIRGNYMSPAGLTADEVWDCVVHAAGFGTAGILGIAGLTQLAKQGIQEVVITVSKFLAERAGWFGLAIMLIDFGMCIYKEAKD